MKIRIGQASIPERINPDVHGWLSINDARKLPQIAFEPMAHGQKIKVIAVLSKAWPRGFGYGDITHNGFPHWRWIMAIHELPAHAAARAVGAHDDASLIGVFGGHDTHAVWLTEKLDNFLVFVNFRAARVSGADKGKIEFIPPHNGAHAAIVTRYLTPGRYAHERALDLDVWDR